MPAPDGPQWDSFGAKPKKLIALSILQKTADAYDPTVSPYDENYDRTPQSGFVSSADIDKVFDAVNIRRWSYPGDPNHPGFPYAVREHGEEYTSDLPHDQKLNTTQTTLFAPGALDYFHNGPPDTKTKMDQTIVSIYRNWNTQKTAHGF